VRVPLLVPSFDGGRSNFEIYQKDLDHLRGEEYLNNVKISWAVIP